MHILVCDVFLFVCILIYVSVILSLIRQTLTVILSISIHTLKLMNESCSQTVCVRVCVCVSVCLLSLMSFKKNQLTLVAPFHANDISFSFFKKAFQKIFKNFMYLGKTPALARLHKFISDIF